LTSSFLVALGIGLFFLRKRLLDNKTDFDGDIDENTQLSDTAPAPRWEYKMLKSDWLRWLCAIFFIAFNGFLIIIPMVPSKLANGTPRRIPNWKLPAVVLPFFAAGAVAGFLITIIATHMEFRTGPNQLHFPYAARRWVIQYPRVSVPLQIIAYILTIVPSEVWGFPSQMDTSEKPRIYMGRGEDPFNG